MPGNTPIQKKETKEITINHSELHNCHLNLNLDSITAVLPDESKRMFLPKRSTF